MNDWPRLLVCPDRPHLLARCRAHKVHLMDGPGANAYPKLTFTIDIYFVTGRPSSICRRVSSDSHTIYGQRLYDWDCSFVDADRLAVAYRDAYFGPKTLCLLLYDMSKRQFRSCCLTGENYEDDRDEDDGNRYRFELGPMAARASAEEAMADYMLKGDRLFVVSPPNLLRDFRTLTSYKLMWPLETSLTLTPLWEPKPELKIKIRPPVDFRRRRFYSKAAFLRHGDDDVLRVFDGDGAGAAANILYDRFFSVDLRRPNSNDDVQDSTWTRCSPDPSTNRFPPNSTSVDSKDLAYCRWTSTLYMWHSSIVWTLAPSSLGEIEESENRNPIDIDWRWTAVAMGAVDGGHRRRSKLLSWPAPTASFAVNGHGGIYELDNDDDVGAPRFVGYIGSSKSPPTLTYLTAIRLMDAWNADAFEDFFAKSVAQLRDRGYPFCLARLAFIKKS